MEVMRHKTTAEFLTRAKTWLEKAEDENNLILGIATFFKSYSEQLKIQPYFLTLTQRMIDSGKKFCRLYADLVNPVPNNIENRLPTGL